MILVKGALKFLPLTLCLLLLMAASALSENTTREIILQGDNLSVPVAGTLETDAHTYQGYLRIYVVELVSRYRDYLNAPYENGHLGFAVNQPITLNYGDTIGQTVTWNSGSYGAIAQSNVAVIAVIFNGQGHDASCDTVGGHEGYFQAYYVEAAAKALPGETSVDTASGSYTHNVFLEEATKHA